METMATQDPLISRLKGFISVADLSQKTGVSRAVIYKYGKAYSEGGADKIPQYFRDIFVALDKGTDEDVENVLNGASRSVNERKAPYGINGLKDPSRRKTSNDVRAVCIRDGGRFMVIFHTTPTTTETVLKLYVHDSGDYYCIGKYRPEEDRSFIIIEGLVTTIDYYYEVEQVDNDENHRSGLKLLGDESDLLNERRRSSESSVCCEYHHVPGGC